MAELPKPSRETVSRREIPERPLRDILRETIDDLTKTLRLLTAYGVKVPAGSRLHQAQEILEEALASGRLVPSQRGDDLGLRSLELSLDYSAIASTLPTAGIASVRRELRDSLTGPLAPPDTDRGPLQLQSQFVVRAALVRSGLDPSHPATSSRRGKAPDLVVTNSTDEYAVEVKRPQSAKNVIPRLASARDQLAAVGLPGAVLVDVTDCLRGLTGKDVDAEIRRLALGIYDEVFENGVGHRKGYEGIMVAGTFARVAWNATPTATGAMVEIHNSSTIGVFADAPDTPADRNSKWLRARLEDGLGRLEQTLDERHRQASS